MAWPFPDMPGWLFEPVTLWDPPEPSHNSLLVEPSEVAEDSFSEQSLEGVESSDDTALPPPALEVERPPLRFIMPPDLLTFHPFPRLPPEIRFKIWEDVLVTSQIHFLKLQSPSYWRTHAWGPPAAPPNDGSEEENPVAREVKYEVLPGRSWHTGLMPNFYFTSDQRGRYYSETRRQIKHLELTCKESAQVVKNLVRRSKRVSLRDDTSLMLAHSSDMVCLEYMPDSVYDGGCSLDVKIYCHGLETIRRVAMRFSHVWGEVGTSQLCSWCRGNHREADGREYPSHIYQFLARHVPSLEEFFLIDYYSIPKRNEAPAAPSNARVCKWYMNSRSYCEANPHEWTTKPEVEEVRSWLQKRFVQYASTSKLSRHQNPSAVHFGILACEWDIPSPKVSTAPPRK
ncbi:hypothetical protein B0I35DRAFT_407890 [Stachybotrys elegans]|uniref:2EXR domain-containing protein n=1 Tax=Stachybotrys elegans TaxID=80388 RepID=A0A8K0SXD3_9HYPO|nr:hypothetical protein B0I35DRAFT_407890 [Stachybotrys elegans]